LARHSEDPPFPGTTAGDEFEGEVGGLNPLYKVLAPQKTFYSVLWGVDFNLLITPLTLLMQIMSKRTIDRDFSPESHSNLKDFKIFPGRKPHLC